MLKELQLSLLLVLTNFSYWYAVTGICSPFKPIKSSVQIGKHSFSPVGVGTWSWGNKFLWNYSPENDANLRETYNHLVANGINWFDTADSYGTGKLNARSEVLLGKFSEELKRLSSRRSKSFYCTKVAPFPWIIGESMITKRVKNSRDRLNRPIDMVQLHWPPTFGWQEENYVSVFTKFVRNGDAIQIGLSNFGPKRLVKVINTLSNFDQNVYSNQVQFSLLSTQPLKSELAEVCLSNNIRLIGYSPLALGLLSDKYNLQRLPKGPRSILFREFLPVIDPLLSQLREIAKTRKKSVSQIAINWALQKGILPLVGVRTVEQAKDCIGASTFSLTVAEVDELDRVVKKLPKSMVQNFNQSD